MRRFFAMLKAVLSVLAAVGCAVFFYLLFHTPAFEQGKNYTYYLGASSSSLMVESASPVVDKLTLHPAGESTVYSGDCYKEIKARFHAKLLFTEEAGGVVNYYLYSGDLGSGLNLNGYCVNLHIAVKSTETAVGTPLIFGGF